MKIHIAEKQHYACILCGRCCQRFHVLLRPDEIPRLEHLQWGKDKPACADDFHSTIGGYPYFKRKADGSCIFQDADKGCLMHRRFGYSVKALTCRGYPLNFVSTFPGEVSVLARMDCPAALDNCGPLLSSDRKAIEAMATELGFGHGFTPTQLDGVQRYSVECLVEHIRSVLANDAPSVGKRICQAMTLVRNFQRLGSNFLNDLATLKTVLPSMTQSVLDDQYDWPRLSVSAFSRGYFRLWFNSYAQRDGELVDRGAKTRMERVTTTVKLFCGHGNLREYSPDHPDIPLAKVPLFGSKFDEAEQTDDIWEHYLRFLDVRLECYQFFGHAFYNVHFFDGFRALLLTYAHALAFARIRAASESREKINKQDVRYAVSCIDHVHGRTANLSLKPVRNMELYFALPRFQNLVFSLGGF